MTGEEVGSQKAKRADIAQNEHYDYEHHGSRHGGETGIGERGEEKRERIILKGEVPSPLNPPGGCNFHVRCYVATPECTETVPPLIDVGGGHEVACIRISQY